MDKEKLLLKLQEEKRLKCNAQHREAYLREKINVEMLEIDEEDDADFKLMFGKIPCAKLPEDLVLFWEEQEKASGAKDISGTQSKFNTMKITSSKCLYFVYPKTDPKTE